MLLVRTKLGIEDERADEDRAWANLHRGLEMTKKNCQHFSLIDLKLNLELQLCQRLWGVAVCERDRIKKNEPVSISRSRSRSNINELSISVTSEIFWFRLGAAQYS